MRDRFLSFFPYHSVTAVKDIDEMLTSILSGQAAFVTPEGYAFTIDVRSYPGRQPEEPDTEKVIRGIKRWIYRKYYSKYCTCSKTASYGRFAIRNASNDCERKNRCRNYIYSRGGK